MCQTHRFVAPQFVWKSERLKNRGCLRFVHRYTYDLTKQVADEIESLFGKRPYVIYMELHRSKLDVNREVNEATCHVPVRAIFTFTYIRTVVVVRTSAWKLARRRLVFNPQTRHVICIRLESWLSTLETIFLIL